jgi:hypothetical protein
MTNGRWCIDDEWSMVPAFEPTAPEWWGLLSSQQAGRNSDLGPTGTTIAMIAGISRASGIPGIALW